VEYKVSWVDRNGVRKALTMKKRETAIHFMDVLRVDHGYEPELTRISTREVIIWTNRIT